MCLVHTHAEVSIVCNTLFCLPRACVSSVFPLPSPLDLARVVCSGGKRLLRCEFRQGAPETRQHATAVVWPVLPRAMGAKVLVLAPDTRRHLFGRACFLLFVVSLWVGGWVLEEPHNFLDA